MPANGDSSLVQTWYVLDTFKRVVLDVTCDSGDGSFTATKLSKPIDGYLLEMISAPGSPAPQNAYNVTLLNGASVDVLQSLGLGLLTATVQDQAILLAGTSANPAIAPSDALTLHVTSNSNVGAKARIILYFSACGATMLGLGTLVTSIGSPGLDTNIPSEKAAATAIADGAALVEPLKFVLDGAGSALIPGQQDLLQVPFACTIQSATLLADQTGSVVVDLFRTTYSAYSPPTHPASTDKLTASAPPTISTAKKATDSTLTGWTKSLAAGDIVCANVNSCATITHATLALKVART